VWLVPVVVVRLLEHLLEPMGLVELEVVVTLLLRPMLEMVLQIRAAAAVHYNK